MSARGQWVFHPDAGGEKIPETVKRDVEKRIYRAAEEQFKGRYNRLEIRFRGQFCYIDAYTEPQISGNWPPPDWPETKEEYIERMRSTPVHLCRLRYFGNDQWGYAFYTYSNEKYELSVYPNGQFIGTPEEAFLISAMVYLNEY
jgi:hypothetical protein